MAKISQSNTKWVKKPGKAGYVIDTRTGKKLTGKVQIVKEGSTTNINNVATYKNGRNVTLMGKSDKSKPSSTAGRKTPTKKVVPPKGGVDAGKTPRSKFEANRTAGAKALSAYGKPKAKPKASTLSAEQRNRLRGNTPAARPSGVTIDTSRLRGQKPGYSSVSVSLPSSKPGGKNAMDSLAAWMKGKKSGPSMPSINVGGRPRDGATKTVTRTVNGKRVQVRQRYSAKTNKWSDIK